MTGFVIFLYQWPIADAPGTPASVLSFCTWLFEAAEDSKFDPVLVAFNAAYRGLISLENHMQLWSVFVELPENGELWADQQNCPCTSPHQAHDSSHFPIKRLGWKANKDWLFFLNVFFTISPHTNPGYLIF